LSENGVDVAPAIKHTHDFGPIVSNPVENDVAMRNQRPQPRPQFVSRSTSIRMRFNQFAGLGNFADHVSALRCPAASM
jgi:hypothetical protein